MTRVAAPVVAAVVLLLQAGLSGEPRSIRGPLEGRPDAIIDLNTAEGQALARAAWTTRAATSDDLRPADPAFGGGAWEPVAPGGLLERRGPGHRSAAWYRTDVTVPDRVGALPTAGTAVVFEIVVDDYAEVWVNGELPRRLGQQGGSLVAGFNAPNRIVLTDDARPGETFRLAVYALNAPLSDPPANRIWIRSATLDVYRKRPDRRAARVAVDRRHPRLDRILPASPMLEHLATGFQFTEGPVWVPAERALLFSDPNDNTIYRFDEPTGVSVFRVKSGYTGVDIGNYHQPGSNGLALDREGRLTIAEHGNRRITRLEKNGDLTVLADRYQGRRLNSPNDLVYRSDGALYFTDPPFGLPKAYDDPARELPWSGVFRLANGELRVVSTDLTGPNGLAFSPDERYLYVTNWDERRKIVMRYDVQADGSLVRGTVFFDMTGAPGAESLDGIKVDRDGHLYVSGPGGLWIIAPDGTHLGTIGAPELAANLAWGDDGRSLYLTARTGLYRLRTLIPGAVNAPPPPTSR
ncbi:MAG: SMP-30/gluconolactonase/LRE family protein [Acidobacteriota bacterium]